jgi:hypothetical protein
MTTDKPAISSVPPDSSDRCQLTQHRFEREYRSRSTQRNAGAHLTAGFLVSWALFISSDSLLGIPVVYFISLSRNYMDKTELNERLIRDFCKEPEPFSDPDHLASPEIQ